MAKALGKCFDRDAEFEVREHWRPHWAQAETITFITFRTADSLPPTVRKRWNRERLEWLANKGFADLKDWRDGWDLLNAKQRFEFQEHFNRLREGTLDECHGQCPFRDPSIANLLEEVLLHFDGSRYQMGDFVIMPNHVHLLVSFPSKEALKSCTYSWMHFSARRINQVLKRSGTLWQQESFDHLVRSPEHYSQFRNYIRENGPKAGLQTDEYLYREWDG